jgi:glycosyltransferase involved in cell wall biosynthesis
MGVEGRIAQDLSVSGQGPSKNTILIISHDVVGSRMAGPGIRYWQLAQVLSQHLRVILAAPDCIDLDTDLFELWRYDVEDWGSLAQVVDRSQAILACGDVLDRFPQLSALRTPLIVDGYDPHPLETLALYSGSPQQEALHRKREQILQLQCRAADLLICASERQRDWWLGLLEATGRINVHTYDQDPSLRSLVDVVPFGLPSSPIRHTRQVMKGVWPGIGHDDKVVLWGGGLWQWLDPLTAIQAMARIRVDRPDVRSVFPGTRHPNPNAVPKMPVLDVAIQLAEELGLRDRCVFFGDWVPYPDWPNYLAESDVAVSLHLNTVEARLAFRSRLLDYVWAGLPMVVTGGDATSELVQHWGLGKVVGYQDVEMVHQVLLELLNAPRAALSAAFESARKSLTWERAAEPLLSFCLNPKRAADKVAGHQPQWDAGALQRLCADQQCELDRLRSLVRRYESGRFIRFSRWLRSLRGPGEGA